MKYFAASPTAHVQKNLATIIGSNVEVNIDVPSELSLSDNTKDKDNHITLQVQSRIDNEEESVESLEKLAKEIEAKNDNSKEVTSEVWRKYAKKGDYWKTAKHLKNEETEVAETGNNSNILNILNIISTIVQTIYQIVVSYLQGDYLNIVSTIFNFLEKAINYFLERRSVVSN